MQKKYAKPKEMNGMERRAKIITEYRQPGGDGENRPIVGIG